MILLLHHISYSTVASFSLCNATEDKEQNIKSLVDSYPILKTISSHFNYERKTVSRIGPSTLLRLNKYLHGD